MNLEEARKNLVILQNKLSAYNHALSLISYDASTTAPKETSENRAFTVGILYEEIYKLQTSEETVSMLEYLDGHKEELTEIEAREVEILYEDIKMMKKIPMDEYLAFQTLIVESDDVWHKAKEASDFAMFEPYLEKVFEAMKKQAGYVDPDKKVYDFWLNKFEDGLTMETCNRFFEKLKSRLVPLLKKIASVPQVDDSFTYGCFPEDKQAEFSKYLMETMGLDLGHVGLGATEHPFTTSLGSHLDERITTHYYPETFVYSMYSVVHEGGHALYDTGSEKEYAHTVIDGGVSMGIHESQSRFYENIIGRSEAFCNLVFPKVKELFPELSKYTARDFYKAVNKAEPSLIRTEADEVTYCLHIMIRYELEKRILAGELKVHDLPAEWNRLYKEYLGIDVPDDKHGVLQDTHWSSGLIGYFPSYALGSAYGAQFLAKMQKDVDVMKCINEGNFAPINEWNREHIWKYGSLHKSGKLLKMVLGEDFDPDYYLDYLETKMKDIYGI